MKFKIYEYEKIINKEIDIKEIMNMSETEDVVYDYICSLIKPRDYLFGFNKEYKLEYECAIKDIIAYAKKRNISLDFDAILQALYRLYGLFFEVRFFNGGISGINILDRYVIYKESDQIKIKINSYIIKAIDPNEYEEEN